MDKKGGISISMIVIASIGVIVLSIVAALVINAGGDVQNARSCSNVGECSPQPGTDGQVNCPSGTIAGASMNCPEVRGEGSVCCIRTQ